MYYSKSNVILNDMINNLEKLKEDVTERLKVLNPEKIILFGSYAYSEPTEDSDLDIYVIKRVDIQNN